MTLTQEEWRVLLHQAREMAIAVGRLLDDGLSDVANSRQMELVGFMTKILGETAPSESPHD
jgi:hypothetical protein